MRLADVDALLKEAMKDGAYGYVDVWQIENAPTVEAIPKEFIEKKIDEYLELGLNSIAKELKVILTEWEEENDISKTKQSHY